MPLARFDFIADARGLPFMPMIPPGAGKFLGALEPLFGRGRQFIAGPIALVYLKPTKVTSSQLRYVVFGKVFIKRVFELCMYVLNHNALITRNK